MKKWSAAERPPLRADGGRREPGVPSMDDADQERVDEPEQERVEDAEQKPADEPERTASGRRMPGVPQTTGDPEAEAAASESCGSAAAAEQPDEPQYDLTTAFTFEALQNLANPAGVLSAARSWSDWVGMVGEADAPTMNTFLRRRQLGVDFFNGGSGGPEARLSEIATGDSPFREERLVLVGLADQSWIAEAAGWEFEPLEDAAEQAGWPLE